MTRYTAQELDAFAIRDLLSDAEVSEQQAKDGRLYPERGITEASLLEYAARCREYAERFKDGGAHRFVLNGYKED